MSRWVIASGGGVFAGGFSTGIYETNSPEACRYIAEDSRANVVVVDSDEQLAKILKVQFNFPRVFAFSGRSFTHNFPNL